ncbi:MAG: hypothetical protein IT555_10495 [Acetobacteraceae bacterium]|nr:hypothetical protein [Acetobacteraceae bacterium]
MSRSLPPALSLDTMLNKVPEVTLVFWIIKIMATTVGETAADFLNVTLNLGLNGTSVVMGGALLVALLIQIRARRYIPWAYWLAVVFVSVVGTLITDNLTDNLGVNLFVTTAVFSVALAATFFAWHASERTLSVHTIVTTKRELFYWAAILFTFALGTASGDLMAEKLQLGYGLSALVVGALIAATYACYRLFALNAVLAFWIAYVLTRPLGASFGDLLSQPLANGGLGLGTTVTSFIFLAVISGLVVLLTLRRRPVAVLPGA